MSNKQEEERSPLQENLITRLHAIKEQGQFRQVIPLSHTDKGCITIDDKQFLNLAGNDYLGLATNRNLHHEFFTGLNEDTILSSYGMGSTASRLMTGNTNPYATLEKHLKELYATESALVFNSGYHINIGILPALAEKKDLILADKLCHASLIDGMRLSRAKVIRYPHLDYEAIERILRTERSAYRHVYIVTESIFSMDGDEADLVKLVDLKNRYTCTLYVDEAHGVGIRGARGCGLAEEQGIQNEIELLTGTFGKAYGGQGAFVVCTKQMADFLLNTARSQIFTTGLPPISVHWLCFIIEKIPHLQEQRRTVACLAEQLRQELAQQDLRTHGTSNIVPVMIGDSNLAMNIAENMAAYGFWVKAVRPPTVPANTSRLRLSINAAMEWSQLAPLPQHIAKALREHA
ncbi:aminotransferase class I/II-fold pyridoxal phosphate-dependent enzyme [Desulfogranum japonicum]|uniref:aminotransferase class I/II-fold pyridoxal phosphate-dependent enzyme n=1 Tax=Desulfogranum japonicum TaxID=231447 RepID=UPI0003F4F942|nr:8-amino-7-oxononanoate synthase [Desulfogranum japonicum]